MTGNINGIGIDMAADAWAERRADLVKEGRLREGEDGGAVYSLKHPFRDPVKDAQVEQVRVRRPKAKHLRKAGGADNARAVEGIVCAITGLDPVAIGEMDAEDYIVLAQLAGDFIEGRPLIGRTPSA